MICPLCQTPSVTLSQTGEDVPGCNCHQTEIDRQRRLELESLTADIGRLLGPALPKGTLFCLVLVDNSGQGNMAYISNAERPSMLHTLRELVAKVDGGPTS